MKVDPRFLTSEGPEVFTGNELLIKGALETEGGVHLLGGYPGSPISGFFDSLAAIKDLLIEKGIRAVINNNEALAAAMLNGSQTLPIRAIIAMKSVGVHVAADALALGNLAGAHSDGGAIVVYGDDPWSDSTQVPADSRYISKHLFIPVIEPASPQEEKDFVDLSFKLSRMSELFAGYVTTTNLADGGGTALCRANQYPTLTANQGLQLETAAINLNKRVLLPPRTWWQEETLSDRHERAIAASKALGLNRIEHPAHRRKPIGFATSGMAHAYLVQALWELGLLGEMPILKFGLSYPIDPNLVRQMAGQCERLIVVEERRGFLEEQINEVVLKDRQSRHPGGDLEVWGKQFPNGLKGMPVTRGLHPSIIMSRLAPLLRTFTGKLAAVHRPEGGSALDREMETIDTTEQAEVGTLPGRSPTFCPGCPHRDSADLCLQIKKRFMDSDYMKRTHKRGPMDLLFHGDTGCYTMLMFPPNTPLMHDYSGMGLGGGTGAGTDPFVANKEVVFMGDSTFFHSGQIAISQAIKFGQDITFIILDNRTTAMTGHQPTPGVDYDILGNPTAWQDIEEILRGMSSSSGATVVRANPEQREKYRDLLEQVFLADGVKIVIADKECGITRQRRRRREERELTRLKGHLPSWQHMNINQEVCRFCLACVEATGCPGLKHADTDYGRKMDTDVSWCVNDGACERIGACDAFEQVTVLRRRPPRSRLPELGLGDIPEPPRRKVGDVWRCCLTGVGGMGIGVATSILVRAGHKEGYRVIFLDKKGLAIRNGGVVSQVVYNISDQPITPVIPYGKADLLIGVDILEAARTLDPRGRTRIASPDRTAAVINTDKAQTISGLMGQEDFDPAELERLIRRHTRPEDFLARNITRICEKYLGNKLYANIMMLGFAFQKGLIPVCLHSMAWAIKDTIRTDFRKNLYAFNMGRKLVLQNDLFQGPPVRTDWRELLEEKCRWTIRRFRRGQRLADELRVLTAQVVNAAPDLEEPLKRAIVVRTYDCLRWGGLEYARRYADAVREVYAKDDASRGYAVTRAVIHNLASAMLIKDAVFVAELSTSPEKYARDREKYNVNPANGDRIVYRHLWHPTIRLAGREVRATLALSDRVLRAIKRMRWLRKLSGWHRDDRQYLHRYEASVAGFLASSGQGEYGEWLVQLGSPQCMNCLNPRCREAGCPLASLIPQWVQLAYQERWREAAEKLLETNNFPEFTAAICPGLCQDQCKQSLNGYPVQVRGIESRIIERAFAEGWIVPRPAERKTGRKVAVIGSGPAGLAAAQQLARTGHQVVVFERDEAPGGLLRYGIPDFRLEKSRVDRLLEQLKAEGVDFRTAVFVAQDVTGLQLREEFDAICLAVGASRPRDLNVPGRRHQGVHLAMEFLRQQNLRVAGKVFDETSSISAKGKVVAVIGAGLTGEDCVETALLQGAQHVHQLEILPQSRTNGQGRDGTHDQDEVTRRFCVAVRQFGGDGMKVGEVRAVRVRWAPSADGPVMKEIPDSEFAIKADLVILATGFAPAVNPSLAEQLHLATDGTGRLVVKDFATSAEGVFAAGDVVTGPAYVVTAIDSGRKAAARIEAYLAKLPVSASVAT